METDSNAAIWTTRGPATNPHVNFGPTSSQQQVPTGKQMVWDGRC